MNRQIKPKTETRALGHSEVSAGLPLYLQIIRPSEFVKLGAEGKLDLEASREALAKLARALRARKINRALLDGRKMRTELTPDELAALVRSFDELGFTPFQRLALLHNGDQAYRARLFALIGKLSGWKISAFEDYERALEWLGEDSDSTCTSEPAPAGEPVPIRHLKTRRPTPRRLR